MNRQLVERQYKDREEFYMKLVSLIEEYDGRVLFSEMVPALEKAKMFALMSLIQNR